MENAVDAIKMAFAVLVFVAALSLAMFSFTQVRQVTARITDESDMQEYYSQLRLEDINSVKINSRREVGVETIIPTLYRYYKENYTVLFYSGKLDGEGKLIEDETNPISLYTTETDNKYLEKSFLNKGNTRSIFGFDLQDEQIRREPWIANLDMNFNFINAFIKGGKTEQYRTSKSSPAGGNNFGQGLNPDGSTYNYYEIVFGKILESGTSGLIGKNYKVIERFGEYNYNITTQKTDDDEKTNVMVNITDSSDILASGDVVKKNNQTTKRVIQYIFIN